MSLGHEELVGRLRFGTAFAFQRHSQSLILQRRYLKALHIDYFQALVLIVIPLNNPRIITQDLIITQGQKVIMSITI